MIDGFPRSDEVFSGLADHELGARLTWRFMVAMLEFRAYTFSELPAAEVAEILESECSRFGVSTEVGFEILRRGPASGESWD